MWMLRCDVNRASRSGSHLEIPNSFVYSRSLSYAQISAPSRCFIVFNARGFFFFFFYLPMVYSASGSVGLVFCLFHLIQFAFFICLLACFSFFELLHHLSPMHPLTDAHNICRSLPRFPCCVFLHPDYKAAQDAVLHPFWAARLARAIMSLRQRRLVLQCMYMLPAVVWLAYSCLHVLCINV